MDNGDILSNRHFPTSIVISFKCEFSIKSFYTNKSCNICHVLAWTLNIIIINHLCSDLLTFFIQYKHIRFSIKCKNTSNNIFLILINMLIFDIYYMYDSYLELFSPENVKYRACPIWHKKFILDCIATPSLIFLNPAWKCYGGQCFNFHFRSDPNLGADRYLENCTLPSFRAMKNSDPYPILKFQKNRQTICSKRFLRDPSV